VTAFVQGPEQPILEQNLELVSAVDPSRPAVIDRDHRVFVNYEIYYFADSDLRAKFLEDPTAYTGMLTDPVSLVRFRPNPGSPRREREGRIYFFPDASAAARFDAEPDRFAVPIYKMRAM
jgi:YHS domain-containing protein